MSKNIVLVGLIYDNNLGDQAIVQSTRYMLESILKEYGKEEMEIREVDMTGRTSQNENPYMRMIEHNFAFRVIRKIYNILRIDVENKKTKSIQIKDVCNGLCSDNIDSNTCAIIFAGGGLIKYRHQFLQEYLYYIIQYADKRKIPVMLSAVGVEGYDENSKDCMKLKKAINRDCVKIITTRDDIELLQKSYITKPMITAQVADPACSLNKIYPQKTKQSTEKKVIGLNCVREHLFVEYGVPFDKMQMLKLWSGLFNKLVQSGYECKLFCNGALSDEQFCIDLLEYMNIPKENWKSVMKERPQSAEELANVIMSFDTIIACRLHASIIAYSYGIPGVGLVWNNKQVMFGKAIGYPEYFVTKEQFNVQYIINVLENAVSQGYNEKNREQYCKTTSTAIDDFIKKYIAKGENNGIK